MSKDIIQRILDRSNGGLDIIISLIPEVADCVDRKKKFKLRSNEKTASASLYKKPETGVYYVKDFGGTFSGTAVNLFCYLKNCSLKDAIKLLAPQYGAFDDAARPAGAKPVEEWRDAEPTEEPNSYHIEYKETFSDFDLQTIFAKYVIEYSASQDKTNKDWTKHLRDVCKRLAVYPVSEIRQVFNKRKVRILRSTDVYPIFSIEGKGFKKIYQPLAEDKGDRFRYVGKKEDPNYIFGYEQLVKEFQHRDKKFSKEGDEGDKSYDDVVKFEEVILCSGDRDALNVAALGYMVIWLNSETAKLLPKVYGTLKTYCKAVYNLPDIDATGVRQGHELALEYLDLKTIDLPQELKGYKDWRRNPKKDVRDYLDHFKSFDFKKLVRAAKEYQFWSKEENDKGKITFHPDLVLVYNFLQKSGFYRMLSTTSKTGYDFVRITGNIVKVIEPREVKAFVNGFLSERFPEDRKLRNTFYRTPLLKEESLENLAYIELDFKYYDRGYQFMFFKGATWKITANEIIPFQPGAVQNMVWEEKVLDHKVELLPPSFNITQVVKPDGEMAYDIQVLNSECLFLRYLIQTSRMHWKAELEDRCEEKYATEAERQAYREKYKFSIDGPLLDPDEINEQKQHLINKIFTLGYILFRHKEKSKPWAPFLMDQKMGSEGQSNGGSGKTIFGRSAEKFLKLLPINGKNRQLHEDKHAFENVTEKTELVLIDDMEKSLTVEAFFPIISEGITVNPKYTQRFVLDYDVAPKFIFTSNYGVKDISNSAYRRLLFSAFSDYYHDNDSGEYRESRTPANDFGKDLIRHFDEREMNLFINTMARCLQFHMSTPTKLNPPLDNVKKRNMQGVMGDSFLGWADVYFSHENQRLDTLVLRQEAYEAYKLEANSKNETPQRFLSRLDAWCKYHGFGLNPEELRNPNNGRILRFWKVLDKLGNPVTKPEMVDGVTKMVPVKKSQECLYIRTTTGPLNDLSNDEEAKTAAPVDYNNMESEKDDLFG